MLGMPANSSIAPATGLLIHSGAISTMNTAIPKLIGTPRTIAMVELISVPIMNGNAPNVCVTGFHSLDLRKPQMPNAWIDNRLSKAMAITVPNSVVAATNAANTAAAWNRESPDSHAFAAALGSSDAGPVSTRTTASEAFMLLP